MPTIVLYIIAVVSAYLIGSVPIGIFVVRLFSGRDIREVGSGRTGGTNAFRAAGLPAGIMTAFGDIGKGFVAVWFGRLLTGGDAPGIEALCGVAVVAGHNWPIYLNFKGGAGTTPNVGAASALWPWTALIEVPLGAFTLWATGYASLTSTIVNLCIVVIFIYRVFVLGEPLAYLGYAVAAAILTMIALIPNYKRLASGTERRVGPRSRAGKTHQKTQS